MYGQQLFSHSGHEATPHGATSHAKMFERDVRGGGVIVYIKSLLLL